MSLEELARWSPIISIIVGVVTIATVVWRVGRVSQKLEDRLDGLDARITHAENNIGRRLDGLSDLVAGFSKEITTFLGMIVQMLSRRQQLSNEEVQLVTQGLARIGTVQVDALLNAERFSHNPLTAEELTRFEAYYARLRAGNLLNYAEVEDYNRLVAILQHDRPTDPESGRF